MSISVRNVTKRFGDFVALDGISLDVERGELVALLGPSGCGKTSLLRIIAGLTAPESGAIFIDGEDASQRDVRGRQVGFCFQHYALFRHMTVFDNVAFGLKVRPRSTRPSRKEIARRVHELLHLVQLDWLADRYPSQLSGGQRQRIALARALAVEPRVLLLDEPFGALDAKVRKELRRWLRRLHDELHITSIFVTHDQDEALEVADRIVLMNEGKVEQVGTPDEVYDRPRTPFAYSFLGSVNLFRGRIERDVLRVGDHDLEVDDHPLADGAEAIAYARPYDLDLERGRPNGTGLPAVVRRILVLGPTARIDLESRIDARLLEVEIPRERLRVLDLKEGDEVVVKATNVRLFPQSGLDA
jgi:sulfate/thiosulfate transport system ATP-binding protein